MNGLQQSGMWIILTVIVLLITTISIVALFVMWPRADQTVLPLQYANAEVQYMRVGELGYVGRASLVMDHDRHIRIWRDADVSSGPHYYFNVYIMRTEDGVCIETKTLPSYPDGVNSTRYMRYDFTLQVDLCDLSSFMTSRP